ncbi:unnamed protein product [Nippostrongylus brasiliensis]|uniref:Exonuclease domain-containing protein n=1 Tax=Nippostrongylus brasiliensis TaxID=27835 RepID=A0A0N4XJL3_NIPBR|nr:unnamed protein product [Nippostrongylus brasiliensis]
MDFETTGRIEGNNDNEFRKFESKLHEPGNYSNMLTKLIVESINLERQDLILKGTFAQEWPGVRAFLETCKKPACLVAHNGLAFDYRVLFGELTRCGFIDADMGLPDGVVFVDSYLAIRELEEKHRAELQQATKLVDWKMRKFQCYCGKFLCFCGF